MNGTVKPATQVGIDERIVRLRLQLVASDLARRIGLRIRQRRDELGLTQYQVAQAMASKPEKQRLSDWERGHNKPSERYLKELAAALQLPDVSWFYEQPEQPDVLASLSSGNGSDDDDSRLGRIETSLKEIHDLLLDALERVPSEEGAQRAAGAADRLLTAAESPHKTADDQPENPPAARRRKTSSP